MYEGTVGVKEKQEPIFERCHWFQENGRIPYFRFLFDPRTGLACYVLKPILAYDVSDSSRYFDYDRRNQLPVISLQKAIEKEESDDMAELLDVMETAMVLNPGKPAVMEVEQELKSSIAEEDEMVWKIDKLRS